MAPAKWRHYRHKQDQFIVYEVRKIPSNRYEFRRPGSERMLRTIPRDVFDEIYRLERKK